MSKLIKISIFLFISLISCEIVKDPNLLDNKEINYCINFIQNKPDSILLSEGDLSIAKSLFDLNKLDYSNLQFYRLQTEELGYHVRCYQYVNNLKIFTDEVFFHFNKDKTYKTLSGGVLITKIDLNIEASMIQNDVIELYLKELNKDNNYNGNKDDIIQGCYDIEFGYYDLNAGISYSVSNFTKAWIVKPKGQEYPFAYFNDMTSTTIFYDNGIRY
jgi:Zn-dependent metalloprotease